MIENYPDPDHLHAFAKEPMLFLERGDRTVEKDGDTLTIEEVYDPRDDPRFPGTPAVRFEFRAAYINIEMEDGEYERLSEVDLDKTDANDKINHDLVWDRALDVDDGEDYIIATATPMMEDGEYHQVEAYWLLDEVVFMSPAIDRGR